jgi:hypothetical protein
MPSMEFPIVSVFEDRIVAALFMLLLVDCSLSSRLSRIFWLSADAIAYVLYAVNMNLAPKSRTWSTFDARLPPC